MRACVRVCVCVCVCVSGVDFEKHRSQGIDPQAFAGFWHNICMNVCTHLSNARIRICLCARVYIFIAAVMDGVHAIIMSKYALSMIKVSWCRGKHFSSVLVFVYICVCVCI